MRQDPQMKEMVKHLSKGLARREERVTLVREMRARVATSTLARDAGIGHAATANWQTHAALNTRGRKAPAPRLHALHAGTITTSSTNAPAMARVATIRDA